MRPLLPSSSRAEATVRGDVVGAGEGEFRAEKDAEVASRDRIVVAIVAGLVLALVYLYGAA